MSLTPPGWPRPVVDGWPVPWVSPSDDLSTMNAGRSTEVRRRHLCQVCGENHAEDDVVRLLVSGKNPGTTVGADLSETVVRAMDDGVLHERCFRLATARCPRLRALREEGRLLAARVRFSDLLTYEGDPDWVGAPGPAIMDVEVVT